MKWLALLVVSSTAIADPPKNPGWPPKLDGASTTVTFVNHGVEMEMSVFLTGARGSWGLAARTKKNQELRVILPALKGTQRGKDATLGKLKDGAWVVAIDKAEVGYLKSPGLCSGRIAVTFNSDIYVVGTFTDAGCISYDPK